MLFRRHNRTIIVHLRVEECELPSRIYEATRITCTPRHLLELPQCASVCFTILSSTRNSFSLILSPTAIPD